MEIGGVTLEIINKACAHKTIITSV